MSQQTFPNGQTLSRSALTPQQFSTILQNLTAMILGYAIPNSPKLPQEAYNAVRVGYQQTGQPANTINEDVCYIMSYPEDDAYSRVRDQNYSGTTTLTQNMSYTQVWRVHWTFYEPNAYDHARLVSSAQSLDWVHNYLANVPAPYVSSIYAIADWQRPKYVPELRVGQFWNRVDLEQKYNELVMENIEVYSAASGQVELITDLGNTEEIELES